MNFLPSSFVHAPLLWGLLVVLAPLIIHLINLLRQRRVRWAAMDFLLQGKKRRKRWIVLRQWLLLAARMAAIAAAALLFAEPILRDDWLRVFGGAGEHHIVLLDDTLSMSQRTGDREVFDVAKGAVEQLVARLARRPGAHSLTLLRFSKAGGGDSVEPDALKQRISQASPEEWETRLTTWSPSRFHRRPEQALEAVEQLLGSGAEARSIYLLSDFREGDWSDNESAASALERASTAGAELHLVRCEREEKPNLAVTAVAPDSGIRAAQTPLPIAVSAANHGESSAAGVAVQIVEDDEARPAVVFEEIPPGETVRKVYQTAFPTAGDRRLVATTSGDALPADDAFFAVLGVADRMTVLLATDDPLDPGVRFLATALAPGGATRTGLSVQIEPPRALATIDLASFAAVLVVGVQRLQETEIAAVEEYVAAGGGAALFVDDRIDVESFNAALYRDGEGLAAAPLGRPIELLVNRLQPAPDIEPTDHPLFRVLAGERNPFAANVIVERYFGVREDWSAANSAGVRLVARLRNGAPFVLEKSRGRGKCFQFLTTAGSQWNNWGRADPSFVVVMLDLASRLAALRPTSSEGVVGTPMTFRRDAAIYEPQAAAAPVDASYGGTEGMSSRVDGDQRVFEYTAEQPGFYAFRFSRTDGTREDLLAAFNVDPAESRLALAAPETLSAQWEGVPVAWSDAAAQGGDSGDDDAPGDASGMLLATLIALGAAEVVLAYSCGFHAAARREGAA